MGTRCWTLLLCTSKHSMLAVPTHVARAGDCSNEEEIGAALKDSGVAREDVYITSKLWNDSHGREETIKALHQSLDK